jgi:hypothetical protein
MDGSSAMKNGKRYYWQVLTIVRTKDYIDEKIIGVSVKGHIHGEPHG